MDTYITDNRFFVGLDLGQAQDYTAVGVVQRITEVSLCRDIREQCQPPVRKHHLRHLERFPLGTAYPDVVEDVMTIMRRVELGERPELLVDATGVGMPVVDMLRKVGLRPRPVIIHGGDKVIHEDGVLRLPKRDLVSTLLILFQDGRLKIADTIPEGPALVKELLNFKVKISQAGHDSYEAWREADHDDLVLAVALAAWQGENTGGGEAWRRNRYTGAWQPRQTRAKGSRTLGTRFLRSR